MFKRVKVKVTTYKPELCRKQQSNNSDHVCISIYSTARDRLEEDLERNDCNVKEMCVAMNVPQVLNLPELLKQVFQEGIWASAASTQGFFHCQRGIKQVMSVNARQ